MAQRHVVVFDEPDQLGVLVRPLIPPDASCTDRVIGIAPTGAPGSPAPIEVGGLGPLDPCGLLDEPAIRAALGSTDPLDLQVVDDDFTAEGGQLGPAYRECSYFNWTSGIGIRIAVRIDPVATTLVPARVDELLGPDAARTDLADGAVWTNRCSEWCRRAVVASVEPYLILVSYQLADPALDAEPIGLALARAVIEQVRSR